MFIRSLPLLAVEGLDGHHSDGYLLRRQGGVPGSRISSPSGQIFLLLKDCKEQSPSRDQLRNNAGTGAEDCKGSGGHLRLRIFNFYVCNLSQ
jgi:hypothetical protein